MPEIFRERYHLERSKLKALMSLIPGPSRKAYMMQYLDFREWLNESGFDIRDLDEQMCLTYLVYLRDERNYKSSTLYSKWSKVKKVVLLYHNLVAENYSLIKAWLKIEGKRRKNVAVKAPVFEPEEILAFLDEPVIDCEHLRLQCALHQ